MDNTEKNTRTIIFRDQAHKDFYKVCLQKCRYQDVYHKALVYCLGIDRDTRSHKEGNPEELISNEYPPAINAGRVTEYGRFIIKPAYWRSDYIRGRC